MTADGKRPEERLTGKQRALRGLKYFLGVFAVVFVLFTLAVDSPPEVRAGVKIVAGLLCAFQPALLAGVVVALFSRRRLWQGFLAVGIAVLVTLLFGIA